MSRRIQSSTGARRIVAVNESPLTRGRLQHIQFFTIADTAEMLRVSTRTVRRWIDNRKLVAHAVGGVVRVAEPDLRAFLALHRQG